MVMCFCDLMSSSLLRDIFNNLVSLFSVYMYKSQTYYW